MYNIDPPSEAINSLVTCIDGGLSTYSTYPICVHAFVCMFVCVCACACVRARSGCGTLPGMSDLPSRFYFLLEGYVLRPPLLSGFPGHHLSLRIYPSLSNSLTLSALFHSLSLPLVILNIYSLCLLHFSHPLCINLSLSLNLSLCLTHSLPCSRSPSVSLGHTFSLSLALPLISSHV